jgi:hypothetical protein
MVENDWKESAKRKTQTKQLNLELQHVRFFQVFRVDLW